MSSSASLQGTVWDDADANGSRGAGEAGLAEWIVYLDQNRNTFRDANERSTVSDATGSYAFGELPAGRYYVATELKAGWERTHPNLSVQGFRSFAKPPAT